VALKKFRARQTGLNNFPRTMKFWFSENHWAQQII